MEIANVRAIILMKQDDDNSDWEISENESEDPRESTLSSDMEEHDLDNWQEVLHLDQACCDKTIRTTRVPVPKKQSHADTVIAHTSLPNLRHPAGSIAPPLLKREKSTINTLDESDDVPTQPLPLSKAGGDQNVPQPKAGRDHNIPQHQKVTFEVAKCFMWAMVFTKTPRSIISHLMYLMVIEAWTLAIEAQHRLQGLAGAPVGTPSGCQLPGGPSLKISPQTQEAVSWFHLLDWSYDDTKSQKYS